MFHRRCTIWSLLAFVIASTVGGSVFSAVEQTTTAGASEPQVSATCDGTVPSGSVIGMAETSDGGGYWIATNYGAVVACGDAPFLGSADTDHNFPIVGFAATPDDRGYYLVASDGGIFSYGDAGFYGSMGGTPLNKPVVGMAVDPKTGGYWLVASDGGIFSFNAPFWGSTGSLRLNKPIVGMAADPATGGYWLVASDGGIFSFNAPFWGSTGSLRLNKPVVGMAADDATGGYWLVASDGGIFAFNAPFLGSTGAIALNRPITAMEGNGRGTGYRFVGSDGGIFDFGSAFYGSAVEPPAETDPSGSVPWCSVSLAPPRGPTGEYANITSNIPNYQVLLAKAYTTPTAYLGGFSTDSGGSVSLTFNISTARVGSPAVTAVQIGPAACFAAFTPT